MSIRLSIFLALTAIFFYSCKPQVPDEYIQPGDMEDILYDFHLADAMADEATDTRNIPYNATLNRQAVLRKYDVTQAEFDSSLVYYVRHADRLHKIYENLTKRFEDEAVSLGASASDMMRYGDITANRDTSNLWTGLPATMLLPNAPYNVMSFEIQADSTYRKGDKLIFSFNSNFLIRDGRKNATAYLAVEFQNDSVAVRTMRVTQNISNSLNISDSKNAGIKTVRGFIYLEKRPQDNRNIDSRNDLMLLFIDNIRLVRMRENALPKAETPVDTQQGDTATQRQAQSAAQKDNTQRNTGGNSRPMKFSSVRPAIAPVKTR